MCNIYFIGVVLGSFYYGYVALQIPGGWLALKVGGTRLFGVAVLIASVLTILTPVAARASVILLIAVRIGEGLVLVSICCYLVTKRSLSAQFLARHFVGLPNAIRRECPRHIPRPFCAVRACPWKKENA